jgi:hypothetical protein
VKWQLLLAVLLVTGCQQAGNRSGHPQSPQASVSAPVGAVADSGWARVNPLAGYVVHGIASGEGRVFLAGELAGDGGVVLASDDGGKTLRPVAKVPDALHLYTIVYADSRIWAAGETRTCRGLLLVSGDGGRTWDRLEMPANADTVTALVVLNGRLIAAVRSGPDAALLAREGSVSNWTVVTRVQAWGGVVVLTRAATQDARVVFAGSDGSRAVLFESDDGGRRFTSAPGLEGIGALTSLSFQPGGRLYLGGYVQDGRPEQRRGLVLGERPGSGVWDRSWPAECVSVADIVAAQGKVYVACATGHGDSLLLGDGLLSGWSKVALPQTDVPVTLERLAMVQGQVIAVGGSGLYRGPG